MLFATVFMVGLMTTSAPAALAAPRTGFLEICSVAGGLVSSDYTFSVADQSTTLHNGECSATIELPAGRATITEQLTAGAPLTAVTVSPPRRLVSIDLTGRTATVRIVGGSVARRTTITFDNCSMCV
jgi:hypothetical protein